MHSEKIAEFLGVFADVAREGSFSGVARRRGITPSSVARQIDQLEAHLGTPLFLRSTRLLNLTDAGQVMLLRARAILDALADAQQEVASIKGDIAGRLRVACFPTFGKRYVIPVVGELVRRYPALRIELDLTERLADPVAERLHLVIRIGNLADSGLIATRIASQTSILCASAAFLADKALPDSAAALASHRLIDKLHGADLLDWASVLGQSMANSNICPVFACDDFEAMRLAALAGMGVAYLPDWVVGDDIRQQRLVAIPTPWAPQAAGELGVYALRALRKPPAKVKILLDALIAHIGEPPLWAI